MTKIKTIGCIGLGTMGMPIAAHLLKSGFSVSGYARRASFFDNEGADLITLGMNIASSPAELASRADVVITNVLSGDDVSDVLLDRKDAVIHGAKAGLIVMDHSTIAPQQAQEISQRLRAKLIGFVDAPVSGGGAGAEAGTLVSMLGGEAKDIESIAPLLNCYTKGFRHIGHSGHGQVAKLCNQIAQVVTISGVAEAMRFAAMHQTDQNTVLDVMMQGFASSKMLELMAPKMISEDFTPGMESRLHAKDMGIALAAAQTQDVDLPATALVSGLLDAVQQAGWQNMDTSILYRYLKKYTD